MLFKSFNYFLRAEFSYLDSERAEKVARVQNKVGRNRNEWYNEDTWSKGKLNQRKLYQLIKVSAAKILNSSTRESSRDLIWKRKI